MLQRNILPLCSGSMSKPIKALVRRLLHADYLLGLVFDREDGGTIFLRNICKLTPDYTVLYPRRLYCPQLKVWETKTQQNIDLLRTLNILVPQTWLSRCTGYRIQLDKWFGKDTNSAAHFHQTGAYSYTCFNDSIYASVCLVLSKHNRSLKVEVQVLVFMAHPVSVYMPRPWRYIGTRIAAFDNEAFPLEIFDTSGFCITMS
jgi:hypothetical protein